MVLFDSHTFKNVQERRPGHTDAKKSKRIMFVHIVEKGAANIDA